MLFVKLNTTAINITLFRAPDDLSILLPQCSRRHAWSLSGVEASVCLQQSLVSVSAVNVTNSVME